MFAHERHQAIAELLSQRQRMTVQELQRSLKVSAATLRRDLAELEESGKVVRTHGGVMHPSYYAGEPSFDQKARENLEIKQAIASAACEMVGASSSVLIDSGSTCMEIGRRLLERKDLTIMTNSIPLLAAAHSAQAQVICIGGQLRVVNKALVGPLATAWLENLSADVAITGSSGLSLERGATTTELTEAAVKQAFLKRARRKILVADAGKWDRAVPVTFAKLNEFDVWITSSGVPEADLKAVRKLGVTVVVAGTKNKD